MKKLMGKKVLVTGSAGHLGEALACTLRSASHEVVGLDVKASPLTTVVGSITDRACVRGFMAGVCAVYHAATLHKPHVVTHCMQEFAEVIICWTLVLLEEAAASGVASSVLTGTTSVFGEARLPELSVRKVTTPSCSMRGHAPLSDRVTCCQPQPMVGLDALQ